MQLQHHDIHTTQVALSMCCAGGRQQLDVMSFRGEGSVRLDCDGRLEWNCNHTPLMECHPDCGCSLKSCVVIY